jgi:hypothetical protein
MGFLLTLAGANPGLNANFGFSSWQGGTLGSTPPAAPRAPTNVRIIRHAQMLFHMPVAVRYPPAPVPIV